jgi:hypothetical protein
MQSELSNAHRYSFLSWFTHTRRPQDAIRASDTHAKSTASMMRSMTEARPERVRRGTLRWLASRKQGPATLRRAAMACAVLALFAGRVHGFSCNLGYVSNSISCKGTFYLSTDKAGGSADVWLSADSTRGLQQDLVSRNNAFKVIMQHDGNFVLYRVGGGHLWAAGMGGSNPWRLNVQTDGNVVRYSSVPDALGSTSCTVCTNNQCPCAYGGWATGTSSQGSANGPFRLIMQNDGNLVLYNKNDAPAWAAGTSQAGYPDDPSDRSLSKGTCDSCAACAAGKYRDAAVTACTNCVAGKFSDAVGASVASTCADCEAGKYSELQGVTEVRHVALQ